jgi:hypothetical protein
MQNNDFIDDNVFEGIYRDIDRTAEATQARLQARGVPKSSPDWNGALDGLDEKVRNARRTILRDEAIAAGRPEDYANYRASAYVNGFDVMPFDQWSKDKRGAIDAEVSDLVGGTYRIIEGAVGGIIAGSASALYDMSRSALDPRFPTKLEQDQFDKINLVRSDAQRLREKARKDLSWFRSMIGKKDPLTGKVRTEADMPFASEEAIDAAYPMPEVPLDLQNKINYMNAPERGLEAMQMGQAVKEDLLMPIRRQAANPWSMTGAVVRQFADPYDMKNNNLKSDVLQDSSGVGKFVGTVAGTVAVSAPAMAYPPALLAFAPMGYEAGQQRLEERYQEAREQARIRGEAEPAAPTIEQMRKAGVVGGVSEPAFEGLGNVGELAVLLSKGSRASNMVNKSAASAVKVGPDSTARVTGNILAGMQSRLGSRGVIGAAKVAGKVAAAGGVEVAEEIGTLSANTLMIDTMYDDASLARFWNESLDVAPVAFAAGSVTGAGVVAAKAVKKKAEDIEIGKSRAQQIVTRTLSEVADKNALLRLNSMSQPAMGTAMARHQLEDYRSGSRMAIVVDGRHTDVTLPDDVKQEMASAGINVKTPIRQGNLLYYTADAMAADVTEAAKSGNTQFISGLPNFVSEGEPVSGAVLLRDSGGKIVEIIPYGVSANEDAVMSAATLRAKNNGLTVDVAAGEQATRIADQMGAQMDADRVQSGGTPRIVNAATRQDVLGAVKLLRSQIEARVMEAERSRHNAEQERLDKEAEERGEDFTAIPFDVKVKVNLKPVSSKNLSEGESKVAETGNPATILDGNVQITSNGETREIPIPMDGMYEGQVSEDGVFLIRENGTALTFRNAFATATHEGMHRGMFRSRGGAHWMNMLFNLDPVFSLRAGASYWRRYNPMLANASDSEIINDMIARYEAAQRVLGDSTQGEQAKAQARSEMRAVERFSEETVAETATQTSGTTLALASEHENTYRRAEGASSRKFMTWLGHVLTSQGWAGKHARVVLDMMGQRARGVREANLLIDQKYRKSAQAAYEKNMRESAVYQANLRAQGAGAAQGGAAADAGAKASMRGAEKQAAMSAKVGIPPEDEQKEEPQSGELPAIVPAAVGALQTLANVSAQIIPSGTMRPQPRPRGQEAQVQKTQETADAAAKPEPVVPVGDGGRGGAVRILAPLEGAPVVQGATGPDPNLVAVAERYAAERGINLRRQAEYAKVEPSRAKRMAEAYDKMQHAPNDPVVRAAYDDMIAQTVDQYRALEAAGYKFWMFDENTDPYDAKPWRAMRDLRANKSMAVYSTEAGFGTQPFDASDNPLLADTGIMWPYGSPDGPMRRVLANDLFRAVHDAFGHGLEGAGFRADGEENAWQAHVRLFTGPAVGAMTSETRGQNSWLNFGPHGESNQTAPVESTVFADQKSGLMEPWTWEEGRVPDAMFSMREISINTESIGGPRFKVQEQTEEGVLAGRGVQPFISKLGEIKTRVYDAIKEGTPVAGVPAGKKDLTPDEWANWMSSQGLPKDQVRFLMPWLFANPYKEIATKPLISPEAKRLTPLQFLAEMDAAIPVDALTINLGANHSPYRGENLKSGTKDYAEVGVALRYDEDIGPFAMVPFLSGQDELSKKLKDVIQSNMASLVDPRWREQHFSKEDHPDNIIAHFRLSIPKGSNGDVLIEEMQSIHHASAADKGISVAGAPNWFENSQKFSIFDWTNVLSDPTNVYSNLKETSRSSDIASSIHVRLAMREVMAQPSSANRFKEAVESTFGPIGEIDEGTKYILNNNLRRSITVGKYRSGDLIADDIVETRVSDLNLAMESARQYVEMGLKVVDGDIRLLTELTAHLTSVDESLYVSDSNKQALYDLRAVFTGVMNGSGVANMRIMDSRNMSDAAVEIADELVTPKFDNHPLSDMFMQSFLSTATPDQLQLLAEIARAVRDDYAVNPPTDIPTIVKHIRDSYTKASSEFNKFDELKALTDAMRKKAQEVAGRFARSLQMDEIEDRIQFGSLALAAIAEKTYDGFVTKSRFEIARNEKDAPYVRMAYGLNISDGSVRNVVIDPEAGIRDRTTDEMKSATWHRSTGNALGMSYFKDVSSLIRLRGAANSALQSETEYAADAYKNGDDVGFKSTGMWDLLYQDDTFSSLSDVRDVIADVVAPESRRPARLAPLTTTYKGDRLSTTNDWIYPVLASAVTEAVARGAKAGNRIAFTLPEETPSSSYMDAKAAATMYGYEVVADMERMLDDGRARNTGKLPDAIRNRKAKEAEGKMKSGGTFRYYIESFIEPFGAQLVYEPYVAPNKRKPLGKDKRMQIVLNDRMIEAAKSGTLTPLFSMRRGMVGGIDAVRVRFTDERLELRRYVEEERRRRAGNLPDPMNPYQGARVMNSRISAQVGALDRRYNTLIYQMDQQGISLDQMDNFLTAQHAQERNEYIHEINPAMPDGGSGMTTQDANDILDAHRAQGTFDVMERFANRWRAMLQDSLLDRLISGLITQETYDTLTQRYQHYVPLRGRPAEPFDDDFGDRGTAFGRGLSTQGRGMPQALGRESRAQNVTSQVAFVTEDAVRRIERNRVANRFLRLVLAVNDVGMAQVVLPPRRVLADGTVEIVRDWQWASDEQNFGLFLDADMMIDGEQYRQGDLVVIRINNARLVQGMTASQDMGRIAEALSVPNSIFREMTTGLLNPVFGARNLVRDLLTGTLQNYSRNGLLDTAMQTYRFVPSFWNVMRDEWSGLGPRGNYADFVNAGGKMAFRKSGTLEQKGEDFERIAASVRRGNPDRASLLRYALGWYPAFFTAAETATRLAHFNQRRSRFAAGGPMTSEAAALSSRDVTVDFEKKGTWGRVLNHTHIYMNASIQGSVNTLKAIGSSRHLGMSLVAIGFLQSMMARMYAGDDEKTGLNRWDMEPAYEKAANLYWFNPDRSGEYVRMPQPYGFNVFVALGSDIADAVYGDRTKVGDVFTNLVDNSLNYLNPFGGSGITKGFENMVSFAFPTLLRFMPELAMNTDFAGRPIYPEQPFGAETTQAFRSFENTPEIYRRIAEASARLGGGNEIDPPALEMLDFHPDTLEYMVGVVFSGFGRTIQRGYAVATGEAEASDTPLVSSFYGTAADNSGFVVAEYNRLKDETKVEEARIRAMRTTGASERNLGQIDAEKASRIDEFRNTDEAMRRIRAAIKMAETEQDKDRLREMRMDLMRSMIRRANERKRLTAEE